MSNMCLYDFNLEFVIFVKLENYNTIDYATTPDSIKILRELHITWLRIGICPMSSSIVILCGCVFIENKIASPVQQQFIVKYLVVCSRITST